MDIKYTYLGQYYTEFPFGKHVVKIEAKQIKGTPIDCGIYLAVAGAGYPNEFVEIGKVDDGVGSDTYTIDVKPEPTAPEGPVYVTLTWGVGLFDPFDYRVAFNVKLYLDDVLLSEKDVDMRTAPRITIKFVKKPVEEVKPQVVTIKPEYILIAVGSIITGLAIGYFVGKR